MPIRQVEQQDGSGAQKLTNQADDRDRHVRDVVGGWPDRTDVAYPMNEMPEHIRHIGSWTVDFERKIAYILLADGINAMIKTTAGTTIGEVRRLPDEIKPWLKYPATFDELEQLPLPTEFQRILT